MINLINSCRIDCMGEWPKPHRMSNVNVKSTDCLDVYQSHITWEIIFISIWAIFYPYSNQCKFLLIMEGKPSKVYTLKIYYNPCSRLHVLQKKTRSGMSGRLFNAFSKFKISLLYHCIQNGYVFATCSGSFVKS